MNPALECSLVSVRFETPVLSEVSLRIDAGERVALFGLNGSGKTSLLFAIAGLIPFSGLIRVDGIAVEKKNLSAARDRLGFLLPVPEDQILFPRVLDDVAYGAIRRGMSIATAHHKAQSILAQLEADRLAHHSPFQLSHGQRQRVALAGALITDPALLLLDEPSSALDPPGRRSLARILSARSSAQLIATHDIEFAQQVCTRFLILSGGRVEEVPDCTVVHRYFAQTVK